MVILAVQTVISAASKFLGGWCSGVVSCLGHPGLSSTKTPELKNKILERNSHLVYKAKFYTPPLWARPSTQVQRWQVMLPGPGRLANRRQKNASAQWRLCPKVPGSDIVTRMQARKTPTHAPWHCSRAASALCQGFARFIHHVGVSGTPICVSEKFYTPPPPPSPENTLLGLGVYKRSGRINFLLRGWGGVQHIHTTYTHTPPLKSAFQPKRRRGGGCVYDFLLGCIVVQLGATGVTAEPHN